MIIKQTFYYIFRETSPAKEGYRPDESRKDIKDDDDKEKGDDGVVGATAVVIHERPVVVQAPFIGRSFVKQAPHFQKTVVDQQPNRSSSRASQLLRPEETVKPDTDQTFQSTKGTPIRRATIADQKAGTLRLG
jgi:hypothetical protein